MRKRWLFIAMMVALVFLLLSCGSGDGQKTEGSPTSVPTQAASPGSPTGAADMPNPAAVYCQEQGYKGEIRTAADGSQSGVCIFPDGSECDEWAFYRGECGPSQPAANTPAAGPTEAAGLPNPAAVYCQEQGYKGEIRTAADGSQSGVCIFPDGSECDEWAFYRGECGPSQPSADTTTPGLRLDKTTFAPEEEIVVRFVAPSPPQVGAWVGIIPSDVPHGHETLNDEHDLDFQYLDDQVAGVLTFVAPYRPGTYDFRLHDTDEDGQELASVTFTVVSGAAKPELWLDKTTFAPDEEIQLHFIVPDDFPEDAWVGIIPADVPHGDEATNDEYDLAYDYLNGHVTGVLTFFAPSEPGSYDFRLHDTDGNGQEVFSVSFEVTGG